MLCAAGLLLSTGCAAPPERPVPDSTNWQWDGDIYQDIEYVQ